MSTNRLREIAINLFQSCPRAKQFKQQMDFLITTKRKHNEIYHYFELFSRLAWYPLRELEWEGE